MGTQYATTRCFAALATILMVRRAASSAVAAPHGKRNEGAAVAAEAPYSREVGLATQPALARQRRSIAVSISHGTACISSSEGRLVHPFRRYIHDSRRSVCEKRSWQQAIQRLSSSYGSHDRV